MLSLTMVIVNASGENILQVLIDHQLRSMTSSLSEAHNKQGMIQALNAD